LHINLDFTDTTSTLLSIENSVLHGFADRRHPDPTASLSISSLDFKRLMLRLADAPQLMQSGALTISGDAAALAQLGGLFDVFERRFPIVTPRPAWS